MNILIATDSHKDFAASLQVGAWIEQGLRSVSSDFRTEIIPIGDGGEGTIEALVSAKGGSIKEVEVYDPLFRKRKAKIGILREGSAVIEIAEASGSAILETGERNTMLATSYGTGELIKHALDIGCKKVIVGLGGSIVSEGGMGMAQALGAKFYDKNKKQLAPIKNGGFNALSLPMIEGVDITGLDKRILSTEFVIAADVDIPLLGPTGQARTFGPQKKATAEEIEFIEYGLANWARVLYKAFHKNFNIPLAGAAGGLGSGLAAFLGVRLELGIETVLREIRFREKLKQADTVITGEGRLDRTSLHGKACTIIGKIARNAGKICLAIVGTVQGNLEVFEKVFNQIFVTDCRIDEDILSEEFRCEKGPDLLRNTAKKLGHWLISSSRDKA